MAKILITGSAEQGHTVVLHAQNEARAERTRARCRKPKRC